MEKGDPLDLPDCRAHQENQVSLETMVLRVKREFQEKLAYQASQSEELTGHRDLRADLDHPVHQDPLAHQELEHLNLMAKDLELSVYQEKGVSLDCLVCLVLKEKKGTLVREGQWVSQATWGHLGPPVYQGHLEKWD